LPCLVSVPHVTGVHSINLLAPNCSPIKRKTLLSPPQTNCNRPAPVFYLNHLGFAERWLQHTCLHVVHHLQEAEQQYTMAVADTPIARPSCERVARQAPHVAGIMLFTFPTVIGWCALPLLVSLVSQALNDVNLLQGH
jgi:hypothetical protein